jgi:hypothetical protein
MRSGRGRCNKVLKASNTSKDRPTLSTKGHRREKDLRKDPPTSNIRRDHPISSIRKDRRISSIRRDRRRRIKDLHRLAKPVS